MPVSARVESRISSQLKKYQSILSSAQQRDVSENDTVVIIADMLSDILGYDKYQHITTEYSIRNTYVDLAVAVDKEIRFLIEAKAIGSELKDVHVKQAIDYGANQGIEWIVLSNGAIWRAYKIHFGQPIDKLLVFEIDLLSDNSKKADLIECFGCLSREGFSKSTMADLLEQKQITSKFAIASVLLGESMLDELRLELRRLSPGLKVDTDYLASILAQEVIKRELVDSDDAKTAAGMVKRLQRGLARRRAASASESEEDQQSSTGASNPSPDRGTTVVPKAGEKPPPVSR